jgi:two-component sensor histidine kinase/putative methionine-R-sulfoxide reductase with GAF domain
LWGGIALALLVSAAIFQPLRHRRLDLLRTRKHLLALESLNEISASISARLGAGMEVLDHLAEASRQLLHMDRAGIALLDQEKQILTLVASAGQLPTAPQRTFFLRDLPACRQAIQSREVIYVEDVQDWYLPHNPTVVQEYDARSFLVIPLLVGERMGLLTLSSSRSTTFKDADRRLARLLGSQAAVILANNRLYELMSDALQSQQKLLEQRDQLAAVNAAVYQAGTLDQTLQKLVTLAPAALGVDVCGVTLVTEDPAEARLAAMTEPYGHGLVGQRFSRHNTNGEILMHTRQILVLEDAASDPRVLAFVRSAVEVGSAVYIPLLRDHGEMFGTLVLMNHKPGPFSAEQLNLAQVFAARAAAAIENARLHQQTHRDAETKAMLLRELNHRVKNNLAGIVGLLSMGSPNLPPASRHWLDRVIERISLMARAHELFSGGVEQIALRDLIHQMLLSLSVIHSPQVSIQTDLDAVVVHLNTDRAVSLAMVLHELCHNAIVHGLRGGGILTLHARALPDHFVAVDVTDQPAAGESMPPPDHAAVPNSTGFGLELVSGLVRRELGGHFTLHSREGGGTIATVEFPVKGDETQDMTL